MPACFTSNSRTILLVMLFALSACGGGGGGGGSPATYTIGGTVTGLSGTVTLQNNGGDSLSLSTNTTFIFSSSLPNGAAYLVTVYTQPSGQTCSVNNGSGYVAGANVTNVAIDCVTIKIGTKQLGVSGKYTYGFSVATDASNNFYVAGDTTGGLDGNTLTGTTDFFVTKYDASGVKQFTRQLGVAGAGAWGVSGATDTSGNVYVAGYTTGGLDGNTLTGYEDFFFTKYDSNGVKQYTRQLGVGAKYTDGFSVTTDANGNVYVAGATDGGLDGNTLAGTHDFFVTKYNSSGVKQYTKQLGVTGINTYGYSVATDTNGNVYVAGHTAGGLDGNTLTGTQDFFVTKYNSSGVKQYTKQLGVSSQYTIGHSVTTDVNGNVYVAGDTAGGLDGNTLTGTQDFFVTKYNSSGVKQYTKQLGVTGARTYGNSVTTDANGNVYVAGTTEGGLDGNTLTGTTGFFVTKYDSNGIKQYTRQLGVSGAITVGNSTASDANGNVYVTGDTTGGLDGNTLTGIQDFFVSKYDSSGVKQ